METINTLQKLTEERADKKLIKDLKALSESITGNKLLNNNYLEIKKNNLRSNRTNS